MMVFCQYTIVILGKPKKRDLGGMKEVLLAECILHLTFDFPYIKL